MQDQDLDVSESHEMSKVLRPDLYLNRQKKKNYFYGDMGQFANKSRVEFASIRDCTGYIPNGTIKLDKVKEKSIFYSFETNNRNLALKNDNKYFSGW